MLDRGGVVLKQKGNAIKGLDKIKGQGVNDYGILRAWGILHFGISDGGGGGVKGGGHLW